MNPHSFFTRLAAGALLLVILGCKTAGPDVAQLMGEPKSEVLERLGPPHRVEPDGQGGEIWSYFKHRDSGWVSNEPSAPRSSLDRRPENFGVGAQDPFGNSTKSITPERETKVRQVFINPAGKVYRTARDRY